MLISSSCWQGSTSQPHVPRVLGSTVALCLPRKDGMSMVASAGVFATGCFSSIYRVWWVSFRRKPCTSQSSKLHKHSARKPFLSLEDFAKSFACFQACLGASETRFPSSPSISRVPFCLLFGFNKGTQKEKG